MTKKEVNNLKPGDLIIHVSDKKDNISAVGIVLKVLQKNSLLQSRYVPKKYTFVKSYWSDSKEIEMWDYNMLKLL